MTPYEEALALTLGHEGGYYDGSEARDPNPTNYGVTQDTYDTYRSGRKLPLQPVHQITMDEVKAIYEWYWKAAGCDSLPRLVALTVFDMSINAGTGTAVKLLQRTVGAPEDGKFGPITKRALDSYVEHRSSPDTAVDYCWERLRYYADLAKGERLRPNLLSWTIRVLQFREKYLR